MSDLAWRDVVEALEARAYLSSVTFPTTPAVYPIGSGDLSYPAIADFNGDSKPDIAMANGSMSGQDGSISVLLNNGNGTFGTATTLPAGERPYQVIAGVFTSSGNEDLVVTNAEDGTVGFYAGNGNGTFAAPVVSTYGTAASAGEGNLAPLAAVNLNGNLGLVISDQQDDELVVMTGNGAGSFTVSQTLPGIFDTIVTGAFLGDGHTDIATVGSNGNVIDVFANQGNGTFSTTPLELNTDAAGGSQGAGLVTGDFNGDTKPDLALLTASETSDTAYLTVFLNDGNGNFGAPISTAIQNADDLAVGDFNNDGKLDVVTTEGFNLDIYLGNGDGTFQTTPAYANDNITIGSGPAVADVSGDTLPDIIAVTSAPEGAGTDMGVFINGQSSSGGGGGGSGSAALTPAISGTLPSSVIAGQKAKIAQTLTITNAGSSAYDAAATGNLFLSTGPTITSDSIELPEAVSKTVKLKSGAHTAFKFSLKSLPASVPDGTYYVIAQVTDSSGNTSAAASTGTITVAPPQIDLSVSVGKFASAAKAGKKFTDTIIVANAGNIAAVGTLPIVVDASPDGQLTGATQIADISKHINLKNGKSISIPVPLTGLPSGDSDYLIFQIDPNNTFSETTLANNSVTSAVKVTFS